MSLPLLLVYLYPSRWRNEYGEELCALLEDQPLTIRTCADVAIHALLQRAKCGQLYAPALALIAASVTIWNAIAPFSENGYRFYSQFCFVAGCLFAARARVRDRNPFRAALFTMLLCNGLDLVLGIAMAMQILPAHALLSVRSTVPGAPTLQLFVAVALIGLLGCAIAASMGVVAAYILKRLIPGLTPVSG